MNSAKAGALCPQAIFEFADLTLDARQRAVFRDGVRLPLPKLTYELLLALVEAAPALLTHDELAERVRSEEHTSELQSLMRSSYAVFCLKKKKNQNQTQHH